ncbi:MAG: hypothetical protein KC777_16035 [Cyanobacteria bacterium HKST-UBA02]|nr:hypothetical protein [Cyanobacteria bacterium HKST-UBA02]
MTDESTESESNQIEPDQTGLNQAGLEQTRLDLEEPVLDGSGFAAVGKLLDQNWWRRTLTFIWTFRSFTFIPAVLLAVSGLSSRILEFSFHKIFEQNHVYKGMDEVLQHTVLAGGLTLVLGGLSLVTTVVAIGLFAIRLTAFCQAYLRLSPADQIDSNLDYVRTIQNEAVNEFKGRKSYLFLVWFLWSLLMVVPLLAWTVSALLLMISTVPMGALGPLELDPSIKLSMIIVWVANTVLMTGYFLITLPVSAVSRRSSGQVALGALKMTFAGLPALSVISILVLIFGTLAGYFLEIPVYLITFKAIPDPGEITLVAINLISAGWQGVSAIIIYPLCLAIPCEMIRTNKKPE